ncbi:hypothetical protein V8C86DRAFT_2643448 [Haematococcus lacustris]
MRKAMKDINKQVAAGGMGSWEMERVKGQVSKLKARVAALERLQKMVEQLGAVAECLELLDKRQKEQRQRIATIEEKRAQEGAELRAVAQEISHLQQRSLTLGLSQESSDSNIAILRERLVVIEQHCTSLLNLSTDVMATREQLERHLRQAHPNLVLRPSLPNAASSQVPVGSPAQQASFVERLDYDNPAVRRSTAQALRAARGGGAMAYAQGTGSISSTSSTVPSSQSSRLNMASAGIAVAAVQHMMAGAGLGQGHGDGQGLFHTRSVLRNDTSSDYVAHALHDGTAGQPATRVLQQVAQSQQLPRTGVPLSQLLLQRASADSKQAPPSSSASGEA